jgi:hypothetical protein
MLVEPVLREGDRASEPLLSDLNMLVLLSGRKRTARDYGALLEAGGLRMTASSRSRHPFRLSRRRSVRARHVVYRVKAGPLGCDTSEDWRPRAIARSQGRVVLPSGASDRLRHHRGTPKATTSNGAYLIDRGASV